MEDGRTLGNWVHRRCLRSHRPLRRLQRTSRAQGRRHHDSSARLARGTLEALFRGKNHAFDDATDASAIREIHLRALDLLQEVSVQQIRDAKQSQGLGEKEGLIRNFFVLNQDLLSPDELIAMTSSALRELAATIGPLSVS